MSTKTPNQASRAPGVPGRGLILRAIGSAVALVVATSLAGCDPDEFGYDLGCGNTTLRRVPLDAAARGPWRVGVRTVAVGDLTVEVMYPAYKTVLPAHQEPASYDLRQYLADADRKRVSDDVAPIQSCSCHRDLEPDLSHGPYPVVVFLHDRGGFRTQSLMQMTHWASRGFVVLAADHPGLRLEDALTTACQGTAVPSQVDVDVERMVEALSESNGPLSFLAGHIDPSRIGIVGHGEGGMALASLGDVAQVLIPMAAMGVEPGEALSSTLVLGGTADEVVHHALQRIGYMSSPLPKRLVGIRNAGHLAFTEVCTLRNARGQNLLEVGVEVGICGAQRLGQGFQCGLDLLPEERAWEIIDTTTAAALGETLQCQPRLGETFDTLEHDYPGDVAELRDRP